MHPAAERSADDAPLWIGLLSGTSMDGVSAALVAFGDGVPDIRCTHSHPMPDALREPAIAICHRDSGAPAAALARLDARFGALFADAALALIERAGIRPGDVAGIGSHGQTLVHAPDGDIPVTVQIGDPNVIAYRTGIPTVADFRRMDIAAGGQGAPLAPGFHAQVFRTPGTGRVVLNLGGIANITVLPPDADRPVTGFDTGPANALMDDWIRACRDQPFDRDGAWAASGAVDANLLAAMLDEPWLDAPPPKSTGRELFNIHWLNRLVRRMDAPLGDADVQATLAEFTATTIASAVRAHAPDARELLACGGGVHNAELMRRLDAALGDIPLATTARHGIEPDWVEAAAFAWLGKRRMDGLPGNLPSVTGARREVLLGGIYSP